MRFIIYIILAYVAIAVQIGVGGVVAIGQAWPNLGLILAIFVALSSPREEALLVCFVLGALQDLLTMQPMGTFALTFGVTGLAAQAALELLQPLHPLTHVLLAVIGGMVYLSVLVIGGMLHSATPNIIALFLSVIYTAILSPIFLALFLRARPLLGFEPVRRKRTQGLLTR